MRRFYWVIPGRLAGSERPGGLTMDADRVAADLAQIREAGVRAVLSLTEEPLPSAALARAGLTGCHLPVRDFTPPTPDQLDAALRLFEEAERRDEALLVHCWAGLGRTGAVLAALLAARGRVPEAAIAAVRAACPGAIETREQEAAVVAWATARADEGGGLDRG